MITIKLGPHEAEYKALIKAFYPEDDLEYLTIEDDGALSKNEEKLRLYNELSTLSNKVLPWGDLTGVRPVRIMLGKMYEGLSDSEIYQYMQRLYAVGDEKNRYGIGIARREKNIIDSLGIFNKGIIPKHFCLYVGIPFCPTTCAYCSFTSYPIHRFLDRIDDYLDCLYKELDMLAEVYKGYVLDAVYIGGGTPSTLDAIRLERLVDYIRIKFDVKAELEFCVECGRPDSITRDKLIALYKNGVNRICINPQTLSDKTLKLMGRAHNSKQFLDSFDLARSIGFNNINTDIILGLPQETMEDVAYTLEVLSKLSPESITVHSLSLKRAARLNWEPELNKGFIGDAEQAMKMCIDSTALLGMNPYYLYRQKNMSGNLENTGFSKESFECIYNILMIEELCDIAAAGAGTVSKVTLGDGHIERVDAVKDVALYFERFDDMMDKKRRFYKKWR